MSKKRKASDRALPEAPQPKIKVEPGLESDSNARYSDGQIFSHGHIHECKNILVKLLIVSKYSFQL